MEVYVRSIYSCTGYITIGPASSTQTITTQSAGCREEDETVTPDQPSTQVISSDNSEILSLYPNPNGGQFMIDISRLGNEEQPVRIEVMNLVGQTLLTSISTVTDGHSNEMINLPASAASGTYIVRVMVGKNVYTTKVNISK